jgi:hypothetical protein
MRSLVQTAFRHGDRETLARGQKIGRTAYCSVSVLLRACALVLDAEDAASLARPVRERTDGIGPPVAST